MSSHHQDPHHHHHHHPAAAAAAAAPPEGQPEEEQVPPVVRSVLEMAAKVTLGTSKGFNAGMPGMQGGLLFKGKAYCFSIGYRDGERSEDIDDKGNFMRLRDPLGCSGLSIAAMSLLAWELHKEKRLDIEAPITSILSPDEAPQEMELLSLRDLLSHRSPIDDNEVFAEAMKQAGVAASLRRVRCDRYYQDVWLPLNKFILGTHSYAKHTPSEARRSLAQMLRGKYSGQRMLRRMPFNANNLSHVGLALVPMAIEKAAGKPFEEVMSETVFKNLGCPSAGYGVPRVAKASGETGVFAQSSVVPCGHFLKSGRRTPEQRQQLQQQTPFDPITPNQPIGWSVPPGHQQNSSPLFFNGSLNLFAAPEELGKILINSIAAAQEAVKALTPHSTVAPYTELGLMYQPHLGGNTFSLMSRTPKLLPFSAPSPYSTPFTGAMYYREDRDCGAFDLANCGTGRAMHVANIGCRLLNTIFVKHYVEQKMNEADLQEEQQRKQQQEEERHSLLNSKDRKTYDRFLRSNAHRNF